MASLEVNRTSEPADFESWNNALVDAGGGALFATTHWAETLASVHECSWSLFLCRSGDEVVGGATVLDEGDAGGTRRFIETDMPLFSPHILLPANLGPARRIPREVAILTGIAKALRKTYGTLTLHAPSGLIDLRPFIWDGWQVEPTYAFTLDAMDGPFEGGAIEPNIHPPDHLLSRLVVERKYGSVCLAHPRAGLSFPLLVITDGDLVAPIPLGALPDQCRSKDLIQITQSLTRISSSGGQCKVLLTGDRWSNLLGDGDVSPLVPVETARISLVGGRKS